MGGFNPRVIESTTPALAPLVNNNAFQLVSETIDPPSTVAGVFWITTAPGAALEAPIAKHTISLKRPLFPSE